MPCRRAGASAKAGSRHHRLDGDGAHPPERRTHRCRRQRRHGPRRSCRRAFVAEPAGRGPRRSLRVLAEVGRGAEGVVYRARDLKADAIVALKLLQQDEGSDERLQRFRRELQMARKVTHPNVVRIYDLVELPGRFGLSMELVDGEPLDARIARGKLGRERARAARRRSRARPRRGARGGRHAPGPQARQRAPPQARTGTPSSRTSVSRARTATSRRRSVSSPRSATGPRRWP